MEPLLDPESKRYAIYPIRCKDLWFYYKTQLAAFWTVEEVDLTEDVAHWRGKLTDTERAFLSHVLAFFALSDGVVNENIAENFLARVQLIEARAFYTIQMAIETVHGEMYSLLVDTLIDDPIEKARLFDVVQASTSLKRKVDWMHRWSKNPSTTLGELVVAFACVEGVFFSGSFAIIFWFGQRGLLPGMCMSNQFIARDEGLHRDFACFLHREYVTKRPSPKRIVEIVSDAVHVELLFFSEAFGAHDCSGMPGMNVELMSEYIQFVADDLLEALGCDKLYRVRNPFTFMDNISLEGKSNFFEKHVSEYQKVGVLSSAPCENEFNTNADF